MYENNFDKNLDTQNIITVCLFIFSTFNKITKKITTCKVNKIYFLKMSI